MASQAHHLDLSGDSAFAMVHNQQTQSLFWLLYAIVPVDTLKYAKAATFIPPSSPRPRAQIGAPPPACARDRGRGRPGLYVQLCLAHGWVGVIYNYNIGAVI